MGNRRNGQRGFALMLFLSVLVLGVGWLAIGALGSAAPASAERDLRTGLALQAAKQALLGYVALRAADSGESTPGRLPCPERLDQPGTASEGIAAPFPGFTPCQSVGRLPWKTLGVQQIRDGHGEPLWYAVATGTWSLINPSTTLTINPGTSNQLSYEGAAGAVVAVIIAPGAALNTLSEPGTPPGECAKVNQQPDRYAVPYVPARFIECAADYAITGPAPWSNDRTISITAAEVMSAIAGAVADRLQRQVAPALSEWYATTSVSNWNSAFLPYASAFSEPAANDLCGDFNVQEGQLPVASSPACDTRWTNGTVTQLLGALETPSCGPVSGTGNYRCMFLNLSPDPLKVQIRADAPRVAGSFRNAIGAGDITIIRTDTNAAIGSITAFSTSLSGSTGTASLVMEIEFPLLSAGAPISVTFPNVPDAAILTDSRMRWFVRNNWAAYTYYAVAPGAKLGAALPRCSSPGDPDCLTLNGLPAANGSANDKRVVLTLLGPAVAGQSRPSNDPADYLESHAAGSLIFTAQTVSNDFNDRHAACPFQQLPASGVPIPICD